MTRKFIIASVVLVLAYIALIQWKVWYHGRQDARAGKKTAKAQETETGQRVYSFSFSKYTENGAKELEIEGDSADIFSQNVALINVIAKAYAEESPVTITADQGSLNRSTSDVMLNNNVVATTESGTRLMTEKLQIHTTDKRMETDLEAKVKKDNIHVEGIGATSDSQLSKVTFRKNVTVVIQDPDSEKKTPTIITSDGPLEVDYKRNIAHFSKNVVARHEQGTLTSDYMDVLYEKETRRVSKIIARGNVVVVSKEGNKSFSDTAVYLAKEGRVILGGDVDTEYRTKSSAGDKSLF